MEELGFTQIKSHFRHDLGIGTGGEGVSHIEWEKVVPGGKLVAIEVVDVMRFKSRPITLSTCFVPDPVALS